MIHIRSMTHADLGLGMRLKAQAGWNQIEADWRRALDLGPNGCFVAELDGVPVGTTTTCIFGSTAWVALVLVDAQVRGQGVGKALLGHVLAYLQERVVRTVRLDATPVGRPLYEKLGFAEEFPLSRYDGIVSAVDAGPAAVAVPKTYKPMFELDRAITAVDRSRLLRRLFDERPGEVRIAESADHLGYCTGRPGALAWHVGPCLAAAAVGPLLLADAFRRHAGERVFIDIPTGNTAAVRLAESAGLIAQRPLFRMCRGQAPAEDYRRIWACFGPEKG
ncbi:MAG: GNAT family N-acetyltransferase [Gemmataceae bacterium]|nr:GNAT family N-acetyltransferase [Gemmataceae bacterium]